MRETTEQPERATPAQKFLDDYERKFRKHRKRSMQWRDIAEMMTIYAAEPLGGEPERPRLLNLLARIHRDGGQYTGKHGIERSANDAEAIVSQLLRVSDEADNAISWVQPDGEFVDLLRLSRTLAEKLDAIFASDEYRRVFTVAQLHEGPYTGPNCEEEAKALKDFLATEHAGKVGEPERERIVAKLLKRAHDNEKWFGDDAKLAPELRRLAKEIQDGNF